MIEAGLVERYVRVFEVSPDKIGLTNLNRLKPYYKYFRVHGKILHVEEPTTKVINEKEHQIQNITLCDETGFCTLSLWNEYVNKLELGKHYEIFNVQTKRVFHETVLNTLTQSTFEKCSSFETDEKSIPPASGLIGNKNDPSYADPFFVKKMYEDQKRMTGLASKFLKEIRKIKIEKKCQWCSKEVNWKYISDYLDFPFCDSLCEESFKGSLEKEDKEIIKQLKKLKKRKEEIVEKGLAIDGKVLFDLTFKPIKLGEFFERYVPFSSTHKGEGLNDIIVCPETESFLNLTLWFRRTEKFNKFKEEYKKFYEETDVYGKISKNYKLGLPNKIWRRFSELEASKTQDDYYNWAFVPFLKSTFQDILSKSSPLNYSRIQKGTACLFVNVKTIIGFFNYIHGKSCSLTVPTWEGKLRELWTLPINDKLKKELSKLSRNHLSYFILGDQINNQNERDFIILEVLPVGEEFIIDLILHLLKNHLYKLFLKNTGMYCCTVEEFENFFDRIIKNLNFELGSFLKTKVHIDKKSVEKRVWLCLNTYFEKKDERIYYKPKVFLDSSNIEKIDYAITSKRFDGFSENLRQKILRFLFFKDLNRLVDENPKKGKVYEYFYL